MIYNQPIFEFLAMVGLMLEGINAYHNGTYHNHEGF
jgi:hypothetical protein